MVVVAGLFVAGSAALGHPMVRTPVGASGVGRGTFPVAEIAGLGSNGHNFGDLTSALRSSGVPVLDFDPDEPGTQPLTYRPGSGDHIGDLAVRVVLPALRAALDRAGFDPDTERVDVVSHSMGGLLVRYLVEHGPDGVDGWGHRVDDLVMVATPNQGSWPIWLETRGGPEFRGLGDDMRPGSGFLDQLGYDEPRGEVYTTVGGDPLLFRWAHLTTFFWQGFDDQVPSGSPSLDGAANNVYPSFHGRLLRNPDVVRLIMATLRAH